MAGAAARLLSAQQQLTVLDAGGTNLVAFSTPDGLVLVDSGAPKSTVALSGKVHTLLTTDYLIAHTGKNEVLWSAGYKIVALLRTRVWLSSDFWFPL